MDLISAASAEFERAVRQLSADSWSRPTPSDMTIREVVEHVVAGNRLTAMLITGVPRSEAKAVLTGDQLGQDPVSAVIESSARQAEAFADTAADQPVEFPGGDLRARDFLRFRLIDLVVHAWDIRRGAGLDETLTPAVVDALWAQIESHLAELVAFGAYGEGPSGELPADASTQTRLLDALGRRP
jgi:uncharacterized protein (TIGR03086 family)